MRLINFLWKYERFATIQCHFTSFYLNILILFQIYFIKKHFEHVGKLLMGLYGQQVFVPYQ